SLTHCSEQIITDIVVTQRSSQKRNRLTVLWIAFNMLYDLIAFVRFGCIAFSLYQQASSGDDLRSVYFEYDHFARIFAEVGFLDANFAIAAMLTSTIPIHFTYLLHFSPHKDSWDQVY